MPTPATPVLLSGRFAHVCRALGVCAILSTLAFAADSTKKPFDVPSDTADKSLKRFSEQAGLEVIYSTTVAQGAKTRPVKGEMTPREALDTMLADTGLEVVQDEKTGAFSVRKGPADPNVPRAAQPMPSDRPIKDPTKEETVKLEEFRVTSDIGSYAETISSVGTKTPLDLKDYAGTVQILNASFFADQRARSLEDLFPYIVGMAREATDSAGFTLRGFGNANPGVTLQNLQIDGLPGTSSRYGAPVTANIERVEVLKGPSSLLYGQLDPGGLINIVTKSPQATTSNNLFASAYTYAGNTSPFGKKLSESGYLDLTGPIDAGKHWLYRFIGSVDNLRSFRNDDYRHNYFFFPSLTYRWDADTQITAKLDIVRQRMHYDTGLIAPLSILSLVAARNITYQEPTDEQYDNGLTLNLDFTHSFANKWVLKVDTRSVDHQDGRRVIETRSAAVATPIENSTVVRRLRHMANVRAYNFIDANIYGELGPDGFKNTLIFGINGGFEKSDLHRLAFGPNVAPNVNLYHPVIGVTAYPADTPAGNTDAILREWNYGAYFSDQIKVGREWHANVGFRYDRQDATYHDPILVRSQNQSVHAVVPSVGLMYQPTDRMSLYVSYAKSFVPLPPTTVDRNGNAGFAPETSYQLETGLKGDFLNRNLTAVLAVYDIHRQHVVENVPQGFLANGVQYSTPIGTQESKGVEMSLTYLPVPNWQIQFNASYDDARVVSTLDTTIINTRLPNAPRQNESLWTRYNFPSGPLTGFGVGLGAFNVSDRVGTSATNLPGQGQEIAGYWRVDTALYYQWKGSSVALNVQNVFDRNYILSVPLIFQITPGDPRRLTLSYNTKF